MKTSSAFRFWAPAVLIGVSAFGPLASTAQTVASAGSGSQSATQALLESAHALEVRGRVDLAAQRWQQVLLADPNSTEALGGLARAAKLSGNQALAGTYLDRLRAINPDDPGIARAEQMGTAADHNVQLQQAGKLAQQGQYAQSMNIYRQVYGDQPPPGEPSLAYYETESATEDGRPHAISGLRALVQKFPADSRYQVALGRILTYNPKTRPEGRKLLAAHPNDPQAVEALRQSLVWDAQNPATAGDIKSYLARHPDAQLAQALRAQPRVSGGRGAAVSETPEQRAAAAVNASRNADDNAAYRSLNAKHLEEAEQRFKAILAKNPEEANALAGMGYIRMQQANFGGALSYLTQAKQDGSKDPGLDAALLTSRFWYTMGEGAIALNENDLPRAEKQYRAALGMRPTSPEALEGLGGTLLKAQQPEAAVPYFAQFVKVKPAASHAWRGFFLAEYGAGKAQQALQTERQFPPAVRAELMKDPLFLRTLSSAYSAVGRDADAQRVLKSALDLPFPADTRGLEAETQMQYAGLLQQANHLDQAAGLYRQVLAKDQNNTAAWQGLIRVEHAMSEDAQALQTLESMPPASYARAMHEPGFEATVASIYQSQKRLDVAQEILEKAIAQQTAAGQKPSVPAEVQLAGIYLERNNPQQAYPLYRQILTEYPDRTEAWKGLLSSLHSAGRDSEALAEVQQVPQATRAQLENDPDYLQTVGSVYASLGQPQQAQVFVRRVQQHYAQQNAQAPADVDVQNAWLLYNGMNDQGLYRQLLTLGGRTDLTDAQRRTVQTIWASWAVRRANQAAAAGNNQRALAILNATARSFPDNPGVIKALAGGYARAGMAKQAVAIWKAQDLKAAPASDYKAAVGAALAANDQKDAETWLRFGLDQYPKDPDLLILGAKFEQVRGDNSRAADYYRASLSAMPPADPGAELATELSRPLTTTSSQLPGARAGQDLATLMAPGKEENTAAEQQIVEPSVSTQPYLPSYNSGQNAPVSIGGYPYGSQNGIPQSNDGPVVPSYMTAPAPPVRQSVPASRTRLRDYVPQASAEEPLPQDATGMPGTVAVLDTLEPASTFLSPAVFQQQQIARVTRQAGFFEPLPEEGQQQPGQTTDPAQTVPLLKSGPLTSQPSSVNTQTSQPTQQSGEIYGPYVPYVAPAPTKVQLGTTPPVRNIPAPEVTDVLPKAHYVPNARSYVPNARSYVPNAKTRGKASTNPDVAAANAAAARRRQSSPATTGESKPPVEEYSTTPTEGVQYNPSQAAGQAGAQVTQPASQPDYQRGGAQTSQPIQPTTGDSNGQQYPQPYTSSARPTHQRRPVRRAPAAVASQPPAPQAPQPVYQGLSYPGVGQPLSYQPYPIIGPAYPLGVPPTDADLISKRVPPLRGGYGTEVLEPQLPLTERQQTERDLASLEASYSGWIGGTVSGRYRSGTAGLDRLTDLETAFEASATVANNIRFTIVPKAVFLNSGALDLTQFAGVTSGVPVLGTLPLNAVNQPAQQNVNGIGGEFQVAGNRFAAAVGYTPYEFLVRNVTGRALFMPTRHVTLSFNRDSVNETQLSYAGLRDPGSATAVYGGNIWGGVVSTGGGIRFDLGDERAGFYFSADGADLTGYHVLENNKFEVSAGAYFLAHTFPGYGRLNIGASAFGMHYAHNERGLSYGLGGYFSPEAYFLASVPVTFIGRYGRSFHYTVAGSVGVQTFQEDSQIFFPLDRGLQSSFASTANNGLPCTTAMLAARICASSPTNSNTGGNYSINTEGAYRIADHWFAGGFLTANNTNNYNTITGGFFVRYLIRPQIGNEDYPTGLFPVDGFRPLRVP